MESTHTLSYSQKQGNGSRLKLPVVLACFPWLTLHAPWRVLSSHSGPSSSGAAPHEDEGSHYWQHTVVGNWASLELTLHLKGRVAITGVHGSGGLGAVSSSDWHAWTIPACPLASLVPVLLPSGAKLSLLGWGKVHTYREWNEFESDLQGFCPSTLGPDPIPDRVVMTSEHKRSPSSHVALALAPSLGPPPTKVIAANIPWGKMWSMLTSDTELPPKSLGTHKLPDAPTQGHHLKTRISICFT